MLTLCALPIETAEAHRNHRMGKILVLDAMNRKIWINVPGGRRYEQRVSEYSVSNRPDHDIIQWIRVYKNPRTIPRSDLTEHQYSPNTAAKRTVYTFPHDVPIQSHVLPSYQGNRIDYRQNNPEGLGDFWVEFDGTTGELFENPEHPNGSGLVTETENTSVQEGDIVAIAVRVRGLGTSAYPDLAIGPPKTRTYVYWNSSGDYREHTQNEREWRLNPNMPMQHSGTGLVIGTTTYNSHIFDLPLGNDVEHTLVYQFEVTTAHVLLNTVGTWLKRDFVTNPPTQSQYTLARRDLNRPPHSENNPPVLRYAPIVQAIDWLWDEAEGVLPPATAVNPFNTVQLDAVDGSTWGVTGDRYTEWERRGDTPAVNNGWATQRNPQQGDTTRTHRHPVLYDVAGPVGEPIYYPLVAAGEVKLVARLVDVPDAAVTGSFTVAMDFANQFGEEVETFVGHDISSGGVAALKAALIERLGADSPFEVVSLKYEGGIQTAANLATGPRETGAATRYKLTLTPRLGLKGDIAFKIPELPEGEVSEIPGFEVPVPVDTSLRLTGDVVEPEGTYLAGDEVVVRVPFAADGLTYEGDEPPYITIYLGAQTDENRRHATWQRGDETPGSTVVPFVYVIDAEDPVASSVNADVNTFAVPAGTTLRSGSGLSLVGTADAPMDSGQAAPAPSTDGPAGPVLSDPSGRPPPVIDSSLDVVPLVLLPSDEEASEPKAAASSVPRSPVVFNELGNGSGASNDWLELRNVTGSAVSLKDWELSVVQDGNKEDTSLIVFPDVSVPANGLLLITNSDPSADSNMLAGGEQKGLTHHYIVNAGLSLPDDGKFLLILRNATEKLGLNEAFVDVAGGGGSGTDAFVRETTGDYDTHVWPLQVLEAPGGNTEDALSAGKVWLRAKADVVGYHKDAWAEAAFTGVGYDRMVSKSAETAGTPGYPNGAVKTEAATPRGALTFSEVMLDSAGGTLPQWIELYNSSKTDALNIDRWKLEIQNVDSEDLVGRPVVTLTLEEKVIQPNQTLLIVAGNARASSADVFPADRVYNLLALHEKNLRIKSARDTFLSAKGFYLKLIDRSGNVVDEIGNTDGDRRTADEPIWALPVLTNEGPRSSIIRRYTKGVVSDGASRFGWVLSANFKQFKTGEAVVADTLYYGHADDVGSPGYRQGGALPVELSGFSVTREENGAVLLTWTTESEVDNAGFNVRRSVRRDGGYALLNPVLIAGAGTTGERQTYTFIDTSAKPGVEHYYQLEEVSLAGSPQVLVTRRLRGPVSPAHRALKTLGEVKQEK